MKRWLVASLLTLALLLLLSPGIIGHLAERAIKQQIDFAESRDPQLSIATASFERGWFTSAGQHRIPIVDPDLAGLALALSGSAAEPGKAPVLLIDTRLDHGLVPFAAVSRDPASLLPAIASGVSTMRLQLAPDRIVELPGELVSRISINGTAHFNYRLAAGSRSANGVSASWSASDLLVSSSADGRKLNAKAELADWSIDFGEESLSFARLDSSTDVVVSGWGIAVGTFNLNISNASLRTPTGTSLSWSSLLASAESTLHDDKFAGHLTADVSKLRGERSVNDLHLRARATDLDARYLGPVLRRANAAGADAGGLAAASHEQADIDMRNLLSAGAGLSVEEFRVLTEHGEAAATVELRVPADDRLLSWPGLLLALQGKAGIDMPVALFEATHQLAQQLQPLLAAGFLRREGERYVLQAEYAKGLATINGAPLPIPLPGIQGFGT